MRSSVKTNLTSISLATCIFIAACNDKPTEAEKATDLTISEPRRLVFDKLIGLWKSEDGKSFEQWTKNDNGTFHSRGYSIKGSDTSWNEQAMIYPENGNWIFENTVKNQNDGKAIKFRSTILTETTVQFSNPQHDFPTDINYTLPNGNTINAFIAGPNSKGGKDTIPFNFTRIK